MRFCEAPDCDNPVFGTCKKSRKGYCKSHQHLREDFDKRSITQRAIDKHKVQKSLSQLKNLPENKELVKTKTSLDKWFEYVATFIKVNPRCWNCGEFIADMTTKDGKLVPTDKFYRAASAHIFPKSLFPSVATHPLNFLILGAGCGCHGEFDHSIDKACKMQVWQKAVDRFKAFEGSIVEKHKYLDLFKTAIISNPI